MGKRTFFALGELFLLILIHHVAMRYGINPIKMLDTWRMKDLDDAFEAIALSHYYAELQD